MNTYSRRPGDNTRTLNPLGIADLAKMMASNLLTKVINKLESLTTRLEMLRDSCDDF